MGIDRRRLLQATVAAASMPGIAMAGTGEPVYLSSSRIAGGDEAVFFDKHGTPLGSAALPTRGHGGAAHPNRADVVLFARRPGTFALVLDRRDGAVLHTLESTAERHFCGHGAFSRDGRLLYASENDYAAGRGVIGIFDVRHAYARIGEFETHGIGPHDLNLSPDGRSIIIANGGILTHPETGRRKLNIPDMDPSLCILDAVSGMLQRQVRLPGDLHKLSIRHLAVAGDGSVFAAMQYEGPRDDRVPLVARLTGDGFTTLDAPSAMLERMRNYCGAITMDTSGTVAAVSSPRGGIVTFWSIEGALIDTVEIEDGCGIAALATPQRFMVSSGTGARVIVDLTTGIRHDLGSTTPRIWDNHITSA